MSDTSGLPNTDAQGVPAEEDPQRFEGEGEGEGRDVQSAEPAETEAGQGGTEGAEGAEAPPADFDPAQQPSNPDLVKGAEPPDE